MLIYENICLIYLIEGVCVLKYKYVEAKTMKLLEPIKIKGKTFKNRVMMAPMCMYSVSKQDGIATDFHLMHYTTRAMGGVGYIMIESTAVLPEGRISLEDLGLWDDNQVAPLKKIVDAVHSYGAKIGIQLSHAGRKSGTDRLVSSTDIAFSERYAKPEMLDEKGIKEIIKAFGQAARRAHEAGFDSIELHGAHGYLIAQFISDVTNQRNDQYKDGIVFLELIVDEVLKYFPKDKILQLRISGYEYHDLGMTPYDWASIINRLKDRIDVVDVSSGGIAPVPMKDYPGYQLSFAKIIKEETGIITIGGGQINDPMMASDAITKGMMDMAYFGRKLLKDPYFIYEMDQELLPRQYIRAKGLISK